MTSNTFYTLAVFAIVLLIITKPIGLWLTPIAQGRAPAVVDAIDRRLISVLAPSGREESWQRYAVSLLTFNTLGLIFLYVLQRIQGWLPLMRILICVNGVLKHVNTPDSYLRERCANIGDSVRSLA